MVKGILAVMGIGFLVIMNIAAFSGKEYGIGVVMAILLLLSIRKFVRYCKGERKNLRLVKRKGYANVDVGRMSGEMFERYCGALLLESGYRNVLQTQASNDYGADLVAEDANGVKYVFQCKRYQGTVGNAAIQEVVASKRHYGASVAGIMTNSVLTKNARELALENGVVVYENIR